MDKCKHLNTSVSKGQYLSKSLCHQNEIEIQEMESIPYAQVVSSLMYAITSTRLDICHAVGLVSRYQSNPGKTHWQAVKRIFRYLQGTKNMGLYFGMSDLEIVGFTNADFAGHADDRKSTSGYVLLFGGKAVSWLSKKQSCVAKSTMEAKYISWSIAVSNVVSIKCFIESSNLDLNSKPINMFCNKKSAISLIKSGVQSSKGKYIDVNYHYIQDIVERGEIYYLIRDGGRSYDQRIVVGKIQRACSYNGIKKLGDSCISNKAQMEGFEDARMNNFVQFCF